MGLIYLSNFVSTELYVLLPPANEMQFEVGAQIPPQPPGTALGTDRNKNVPIFYLSIIYFITDQGKQKNKYVNYEFLTSKKYNLGKFGKYPIFYFSGPPVEK